MGYTGRTEGRQDIEKQPSSFYLLDIVNLKMMFQLINLPTGEDACSRQTRELASCAMNKLYT